MNIIVRFYWQHDLDLVALNMHPDFDMGRMMKRAIVAYARGDEGFYIPLPRSMPYSVQLDNCCTHFRLTPGKDDDVIAVLNGFRSGFRNSAIKIIFRQYLEICHLDPFLNEETFLAKSRVHTSHTGKSEKAVTNTVKPKKRVIPVAKETINAPKADTEISSPDIEETVVQNIPETKLVEPVVDLSEEDSGYTDGDEFDLFSAVNKLMK